MSKLMIAKFFYILAFVAASASASETVSAPETVSANAMPAESNVGDVKAPQWKGGKVTVRDSNDAIIDVYPGYLNNANGLNCVLVQDYDISNAVLNPCPTPGFSVTDQNKALFLTIEVVRGDPGMCLTAPKSGPSGDVLLEPCVPNKKQQSWLYQYNNVKSRMKTPGCLTANGIDKRVTLTKCDGFATHRWALP